MVDRVGVDAGARDFPEHAHVLAHVCGDQHRDEGMKKHALRQSAASIARAAACSSFPASFTSPTKGSVTVPSAETRTVE